MRFDSIPLAGLVLALSACATAPPAASPSPCPPCPPADPPHLRASAAEAPSAPFLAELARIASLSAEQRRRELAALEAGPQLDNTRRFQLAALLDREDGAEALERSLKSLGAITAVDARSQALVELMKRSLKARIELVQQAARARQLQDRLEQIKALEKSLQQRNAAPRSP